MKKCKDYDFNTLPLEKVMKLLKEKGHDDNKINSIVLKLIKNGSAKVEKSPVKKLIKLEVKKTVDESEHALPPCGDCGGTVFIPTGTCHVCASCGASQGCS